MTVRQIAEWIGASVEGDERLSIRGLAALEEAGEGDLTFAAEDRYITALAASRAAAAIVTDGAAMPSGTKTLLRVPSVPLAIGKLLSMLAGPEDLPPVGAHPSAEIDAAAQVAADARVGPQVVVGPRSIVGSGTALCAGVKIGADVQVGDGCVLAEGVVVRRGCRIGRRVRIGCNSVVGYDGFGYVFADGVHHKIPHAGNVVVEDDVELGACVCVDRAKWGSTRIGAGAKIDNLCQIAHSVQIGPGCLLAAQVGVAGSTKVGRFATFGGKVGIRDNIAIGDGAVVAACSCVAQSFETRDPQMGIPTRNARRYLQQQRALEDLPELLRRVKRLERRLEEKDGSS